MTATTTSTYADAVRRALDDLPHATVVELVDGLNEHLAEIDAADDAALVAALGPPERYAAELRASAGLPPRVTVPLPPPEPIAPRRTTFTVAPRHVARAALVLAGVVVALWLPLAADGASVAITVAAVIGAWLVWRIVDWAELPPRARQPVRVGVLVVALLVAAAVGARFGDRRVFRYDGPLPTFATVPYAQFDLPDFTGIEANDATQQATELGLRVTFVGAGGTGVVVLGQQPAAGTPVGPGATVVLTIGPRRVGATTTAAPTTTTSTVPATTAAVPPTTAPPTTVPPTTTPPTTAP